MIEEIENVKCHNIDDPESEEYLATCYAVKCDICGTRHEHSDYGVEMMTDCFEIYDDALCYGCFKRIYGGKDRKYHLCPDCVEKHLRYIDFIDDEGLCQAEDEVYAEVDFPLDATHVVRYTLYYDEVMATRIATK